MSNSKWCLEFGGLYTILTAINCGEVIAPCVWVYLPVNPLSIQIPLGQGFLPVLFTSVSSTNDTACV